MITDITEYKWVNIPHTMIIDGGIMPLRENKKLLRGEDICFLLESMSEMQYVIRHSNVTTTNMDHTILGQRYRTVIEYFKSLAMQSETYNGRPMKGVWQPYYSTANTSSISPAQIVPGNMVTVDDLVSDSSNFASGKALDHAKVLEIFEDQQMMRKFQYYQPQYNLILNPAYTVSKQGPIDLHYDVQPPYTWYFLSTVSYDGNTPVASYEKTTFSNGLISYNPQYSQMKDQQFVKQAIVFVELYLNVRRYHNEVPRTDVYNRVCPINATVQDGKYVLDAQTFKSACDQFLADQNLNLDPTNRNNGVTRGYMTANSYWAIVELGDRMDQTTRGN